MRKSLRRSNRGQLIVILAILMSIAVLSVAFSVHQMSGQRQQLKYEPVKETVLAITSDLKRALAIALRNATQKYYSTLPLDLSSPIGNFSSANMKFNEILSGWKDTITILFSHLSVKNRFTDTQLYIDWSNFIGRSYAYVSLNMDVDAYGFSGWTGKITKHATLTIFPGTITGTKTKTILTFNLVDDSKPVTNLKTEHLEGYVLGNNSMWTKAGVESLIYLGGGNYTVSLSHDPKDVLGVILKAVTPRDSIIVSARYRFMGGNPEQEQESYEWFILHLGGPMGMKHKPKDVMLLPGGLWNPDIEGELTPQFSHGNDKQWALIYSPQTPEINYSSARYVNITIYAKPVPPNGERSISVSLYFTNMTHTCTIVESKPQPFPREGWYRFYYLNFTDDFKNKYKYTVPSGSYLVLNVTVVWKKQPYGTFHLQYGGETPSQILFAKEEIIIKSIEAKKETNTNNFNITVTVQNTGYVDATINNILLNGTDYYQYTNHNITVKCDGNSLPLKIRIGEEKTITIEIKPKDQNNPDPFISGVKVIVRLHSASGQVYKYREDTPVELPLS